VGPDGTVERFEHSLPESRSGAQLEADAARELARRAVADRLSLDAVRLNEVSAEPEKRPERVDWRFVFSDKAAFPIEQGDARAAVEIAATRSSTPIASFTSPRTGSATSATARAPDSWCGSRARGGDRNLHRRRCDRRRALEQGRFAHAPSGCRWLASSSSA